MSQKLWHICTVHTRSTVDTVSELVGVFPKIRWTVSETKLCPFRSLIESEMSQMSPISAPVSPFTRRSFQNIEQWLNVTQRYENNLI